MLYSIALKLISNSKTMHLLDGRKQFSSACLDVESSVRDRASSLPQARGGESKHI